MDARATGRTAAVLVGAFAALAAVVVAWGWVLTHPLLPVVDPGENRLARRLADARTPTLSTVADVGTFVGNLWVGLVAVACVGLAFAVATRSLRPVVYVTVVYGGLQVIYLLAANLDPRDRPPVRILDTGLVPDRSFPSGHTGAATAVVGCLLVLTATYAPQAKRWVLPLLALPLLTVLARLYQGAHHVSDVVTSLCYATAWIAITWRVLLAPVSSGHRLRVFREGSRAVRMTGT